MPVAEVIRVILVLIGFGIMYYAGWCAGEVRGLKYALGKIDEKIAERAVDQPSGDA
jgi:hypothetical protein